MQKSHSKWAVHTALGLSTLAIATAVWTTTRSQSPAVGPELPTASADESTRTRERDPGIPTAAVAEKKETAVANALDPSESTQARSETAQPKPEAKTAPDAPMEIKRLVVTDGIEGREPNADPDLTGSGEAVYAFVELRNPSEATKKIVVTFEHATGTKVGHVSLDVPANKTRWRTWARTAHVTKPGDWTAVVSSADGAELARKDFVVAG